ncbi:hypothetical protein Taro_023491 [Colocasia esculenta]|uniref:Uncharacterized protein n=1 Tax=Colocasia esculenta TaxID=4460 RepID=A0A843V6L0_COLES|nr:hypothetical protein [Colocasia esculenta]
MSSGRGSSAASASSPSSVPPPLTAGSGQFTPPPPTVAASDPSYVPPPLAVASGPSSVPPPLAAGASTMPEAEDAVSLQEGGGSFYDGTLREMWINGDKIEPAQASQFITRSIQAHFPGPIHRFNDFPMDVQELLYQMSMEKELKRPPTFQEVFDKTHKKMGTDQYISNRAREVAESYSQQMAEKYVGEEKQP